MAQIPLYKTLTFKVTIALIVLFVLNGTLLVLWDQADLLRSMEIDMQLTYAETAHEIASELEPLKADPPRVSAFLDSIAEFYPGMELFLVDPDGSILEMAGYVESELIRDQVPIEPIVQYLEADERQYPIEIPIPTASDLDFVFSAAALGDPVNPHSYVLVTLLEGGEDVSVSWWEEYGGIVSRAALFSLAVAMLTGLLFWYFLTRRIDHVATAVQVYRAGKNDVKLRDSFDDEIGRVSRHVGEMMERINSMFEELGRKEKMRTELLASVSHELQTPLTVMQGNIETLVEHRMKLSEEELGQKLSSAYKQIEHMSELIDDMFQVSVLDTGQMRINKEPFILEELIEDVRHSFQVILDQEELTLETRYTDAPQPINADPLRLRQVIRNLLSNAIKFSKPGGAITIRTSYQRHHLQFSIEDTGVGIPPEEIENIFKSFYRSNHQVRRSVKGTGLGLHICQQILQLHGARLSVESTAGEGSTFSFQIELFQEPDNI